MRYVIALLAVYVLDVPMREALAAWRARRMARTSGKPLLNVGSGTSTSSATGEKLRGNVNCDIAASRDVKCTSGVVCYCDVGNLFQFANKQFGVVLAANVLRYVSDRTKAEAELHRVADHVIIADNVIAWPQLGPGRKFPTN